MKNIILKYIHVLVLAALSCISLPLSAQGDSISVFSKNLELNQEYVDYLNNQLQVDEFNNTYIWADSIIVKEEITFERTNLTFICNYFDAKGWKITVMPDTMLYNGINGPEGMTVKIFAKEIGRAKFVIPGWHGLKGEKGEDGESGTYEEATTTGNGYSYGTTGEDGKQGGKGGDGGKLYIYTLDKKTAGGLTLSAPGGEGGEGGDGGKGGTTYYKKLVKIIRTGNGYTYIYQNTTREEQDGQLGPQGEQGANGRIEKKSILPEQFDEQIEKLFYVEPGFINQSGWQITMIYKKKYVPIGPIGPIGGTVVTTRPPTNSPTTRPGTGTSTTTSTSAMAGTNGAKSNRNSLGEEYEVMSIDLGLDLSIYPNPFQTQTTFAISLPVEGEVSIRIFNSIGKMVHERQNYLSAGKHKLTFNNSDHLASGMYFVKLQVNELYTSRTMIIK